MADVTDLIDALEDLPNRVLLIASTTMFAEHKNRIFGEGKAADETDIGSYSTEPAYFNPKDFPKSFTPEGKHGKDGGKTKYFSGGYKELRNTIGRRIDTVDLRMGGTLESSYQQATEGKDVVFGFTFTKQALIAQGNEERFKKAIFEVSKKELETLDRVFAAESI